MPVAFARTLRSLRADRHRAWTTSLLSGLLLSSAWAAWITLARIPVYESSSLARLEVAREPHPVQSPVSGRVVASDMHLGRHVEAGDVLFDVDVAPQQLELKQAKARLLAIGPELAAARMEMNAHAAAESDERHSLGATVAEARARHKESAAAARLAKEQLARTERLKAEGLVSDADLARARADADQKAAAAEALGIAIGRIDRAKRVDASDRRARVESLARQIAQLEGEELTTQALADRLSHEVDRRTVRASIAGALADVVPLPIGSVVREGDRVGTVVPAGELRLVAEMSPARTLGRVHEGQPARLRLEGFPWAQHGTVPARVSRVGSEVRDGRVRVELAVDAARSPIPLQHGQPGTVEIELERVAPATLVLRAAGKMLDPPTESDAVPAPASPAVGRP